jgi:hypothetical protein
MERAVTLLVMLLGGIALASALLIIGFFAMLIHGFLS